jgi:hypothetical protein
VWHRLRFGAAIDARSSKSETSPPRARSLMFAGIEVRASAEDVRHLLRYDNVRQPDSDCAGAAAVCDNCYSIDNYSQIDARAPRPSRPDKTKPHSGSPFLASTIPNTGTSVSPGTMAWQP